MSENLEKISGVQFLPIFPLPLVLLPHQVLPLHIFEPRYRQMLRDVQLERNFFGVAYFNAEESEQVKPDAGSVGCAAEIREAQTLPDGRSNILTVGVVRFRLENYVRADEPYLVAEVSFFEDEEQENQTELQLLADEVFALFMRVARAAQDLSGERRRLPEMPQAEPQMLSFLIAAAFNFNPAVKYQMLETRSTAERLTRLREMLKQSVGNLEEEAAINKIARTNGHSKKKINL